MIEEIEQPSIREQCELLNISRGSYYYEPSPETEENLELMRQLDELHLKHPVYGSRRLTVMLQRAGQPVNRKRVVRLLGVMGLEALYPRRSPWLSQPGKGHRIYPYLLKDLEVTGPDQVPCGCPRVHSHFGHGSGGHSIGEGGNPRSGLNPRGKP